MEQQSRQHAYYMSVLRMMENPTEELLEKLSKKLPEFLSDTNPVCQRTVLLICAKFFMLYPINGYAEYARIFVQMDFLVNTNTVDIAKNLVITCLEQERSAVLDLLFDDVENRTREYIKVVISIIISHLPSLTSRDAEYVADIIEKLHGLSEIEDEEIRGDVDSALATAKIMISENDISSERLIDKRKSTDVSWIELICSQDWKERANGYDELLSLISESFKLDIIEDNFLVAASTEKNPQCEIIVVKIIQKMAVTYKNQLMRKLNEYISPIINLFSQKGQEKQYIKNAFDAIASNVVVSPFESPFLEYLLFMMKSSSIRLKKESISFISRCNITPLSQEILEALQVLMNDSNSLIKEQTINLLKRVQEYSPVMTMVKDVKENEDKVKSLTKQKSPELRRGSKRHSSIFNSKISWENWIEPNTLILLKSGQWTSVTKGIDDLYAQFTDNPFQPSAIIVGLACLFKGKTFTPKVMTKLMQHFLIYIKYDGSKITNDAVINAVQFCLDNITDKRFEQIIFEILDTLTEINSAQLVFQQLYTQVSVKNPAYPLHIATYFYHYLTKNGKDISINLDDFSEQIKILMGHSDSVIRKLANECNETILKFNPNFSLDNSKNKKNRKNSPNNQTIFSDKSKKYEKQNKKEIRSKTKPEIPASKESKSNVLLQKQQNNTNTKKSLFQNRLIESLSKTNTIYEVRKSLNEIETSLTKYHEEKGQSTVPLKEFTELFQKLRPWLKDLNTSIVLSATKIISLSLKLIVKEQISQISKDFLIDVCTLLNFSQKNIQTSALEVLSQLDSKYPRFVSEIFLQAFNKLGMDGKKIGTLFIKNLKFEMNVTQFTPFIVFYLIDKSDSYRETVKQLIERFLHLEGSKEALQKASEKYPPAQKNLLLSRLSSFEKEDILKTFLKVSPQEVEKKNRIQEIDSYLPFKILNSEASIDSLNEIINGFSDFYFIKPKEITSTESTNINECYQKFTSLAKNAFNIFYNLIDIVLFWSAKQLFFIQVQEDFQGMINFLTTILTEFQIRKQTLSKYEVSIILPTILECKGRNKEDWNKVYSLISELSSKNDLMGILIYLISNASSVFGIIGILNALMEIIPSVDIKKYIHNILKVTEKIQNFALQDKENHKELLNISTEFKSFLGKYLSPKKEKSKQTPNKSPKDVLTQKQNKVSSLPKQKVKNIKKNDNTEKTFSSCNLIPSIEQKMDLPVFQIYKWIGGLNSNDSNLIISSAKSISNQLKIDPSIFTIHLDPLITSFIYAFHTQFSSNPIPIRLCKFLSYSFLAVLNESSFTINLQYDSVNQIVFETITHLSNGISEPVLNQVLNAIMIKIMEDYQIFSFKSLVSGVSEYKNNSNLSINWFKFAIKCFETCGLKICEKGEIKNVIQTIVELDSFYQKFQIDKTSQTYIEQKIHKKFTNYLLYVVKRYPNIFDEDDIKLKLSNNSQIIEIINNVSK